MTGGARGAYPVTDQWLSHSPLPPLSGAEQDAERLVLLLHHGVDFSVWGGARRVRYWDALTDRVKASTYAGPTLAHWWGEASALICSAPRNEAERLELASLLSVEGQRDVLQALRRHAEVLVLRARVVSEQKRLARGAAEEQR